MHRFTRYLLCFGLMCFLHVAFAATLQFNPPVNISTGSAQAGQIVIADFNGDGKPDLATTDHTGANLLVYLNQGDGVFGDPVVTTLQISNTLGPLVAGDFNEDGKQDLVVSTVSGLDQDDIVMLGNGDGTFTQQAPIAGSGGFLGAVVTDLNQDGHLDLVAGGGYIWVYFGNGDGTFGPATQLNGASSAAYGDFALADFNGDKIPDFVAVDGYGNDYGIGSLDYFPGAGHGTFSAPTINPATYFANPDTVSAADFNGDGKLDLLIGADVLAAVAFGNGNGTFQLGENQLVTIFGMADPYSSSNPDWVLARAADMDGDGKPDAVFVVRSDSADQQTSILQICLNDGTGTFPQASQTPYQYQVAAGTDDLRIADLNGDGLPDIALVNSSTRTITVFLSIKPTITPTLFLTPTLSLTSSANGQLAGSPITFTVNVSGNGATATPTGSVTLQATTPSGAIVIGSAPLDSTGNALFTTSQLSPGALSITASYSGDANFSAATSSALTQRVTTFAVAISPSSQTIQAGADATYTINVVPTAGFVGTINFSCSGLPAGASCSAPPLIVNGAPSTASLTVTTAGTGSTRMAIPHNGGSGLRYAGVLLGSGIFSFLFRRRARKGLRLMALIAFLGLGALLWGCGGGQAKSTGPPGTPAGTTAVTIAGFTSENGVSVTQTTSATLIVTQ